MSARSCSWVFTLNNYDGHGDGSAERCRERLERAADRFCTFMCFQCERAPTTDTPHLQGFLYLVAPRTLRGLKSSVFAHALEQGVHLEVAKGSRDECYAYCSKEESRDSSAPFPFQEYGRFADVPERRGQGQRNDLAAVAGAIKSGSSMREIALEYPEPYMKFSSGISRLFMIHNAIPRPRADDGGYSCPVVKWFYGTTGTGKTRAVFDEHKEINTVFRKTNGDAWFDGYVGQPVALFDDFRAKWFSFSLLLNITDRYPVTVGVKGDTVQWSPTTIYFTCPKHPRELFSQLAVNDEGQLDQLVRRISEIRYFGEPGGEFNPIGSQYAPGFSP